MYPEWFGEDSSNERRSVGKETISTPNCDSVALHVQIVRNFNVILKDHEISGPTIKFGEDL